MLYLAISIHVITIIELLVIKVNGFQPLIIFTKSSTLDVSSVLDPTLHKKYVTS